MFEKLINMFTRFVNFFLKNENKAIRYTSVSVICLLIVYAAWWICTGPLKETKEIATNEVKDAKDFFSMELEKKEKIEDPLSNFNSGVVKVKGNVSKIIVASDNAKAKLERMIQNNDFDSLERKLDSKAFELTEKRNRKVDELFEGIVGRVPAFANSHWQERDNKEVFTEAMNRELFTQDMLDSFLFNTASEIDAILMDAVNEELDGMLKYMEASMPNMTYMELKKHMPDSRTICESIYAKLNNENYTAKQISEAGRDWERTEAKYGAVSKGAFTLVTGTIGTVLLTYGATLIPGVGPAVAIGAAVIGLFSTGVATYELAVKREGIIKERQAEFRDGLIGSVYATKKQFKEVMQKTIYSILDNYKKVDFFKNAVIEVNPSYTEPKMVIEVAPVQK